MDDMDAHRKKRLAMLIAAEPFNGDRPAFIKASGLSKGRVAQLLDPELAFGAVSARRLESALDLEVGWFDRGGMSESTPWPFVRITPAQFYSLSPEVQKAAEAALLSALPSGEIPVQGPRSGRLKANG